MSAVSPPTVVSACTTGTSIASTKAAMRSEWIKLATLRGTAVLVATTTLTGLAVAWGVAVFVTDEVLLGGEVSTYSAALTALLATVGGILVVTAEFQHGTLAAAIAAHPTRWPLIGAKVFVAAGFGLALGAVGILAGIAGAALGGLELGAAAAVATNSAWALAFTTASSILGLGIGMAVRHSTAAIAGLLAWWLVIENLLLVILPDRAARYLPYVAGGGLLDIDTAWEFDALTRLQSALVFGLYTLVALAVGALLLRRRDIA